MHRRTRSPAILSHNCSLLLQHVDLHLNMMSQPPWDTKMELSPAKPYYILHYTYGCDYTLDGKFTPGESLITCSQRCTQPEASSL